MESARGFYLLHGQLIVQILSLSCAHKDVGSRCLPFFGCQCFSYQVYEDIHVNGFDSHLRVRSPCDQPCFFHHQITAVLKT